MKQEEINERQLTPNDRGLLFDADGNEYRNEEGEIEYLEVEE